MRRTDLPSAATLAPVALRRCAVLALALASCDAAGTPDLGGGPDLGGAEARPRTVALSATGHDRLLGVAYDAQGRLYATGLWADSTDASADTRVLLARFTADGALDPSFGQGGSVTRNVAVGAGGEVARGIVVQPSGQIVISATVEHPGSDPRDRDVAVLRFNTDGTLDEGFGQRGVALLDLSDGAAVGTAYVADTTWGLAQDGAGRLLVHAAQRRDGATDTDFVVLRLTADGVVDTSFGVQGRTALDINNRSASPRSVTVLPDGSVVAAGYMNDGGPVKPVLYKLTAGGALDPSFGQGGVFNQGVLSATTEAYAAALQGTSLVTTGYGRAAASESLDWVSLRVTGAGALDPSYGTGGFVRLDVAGFHDHSRQLLVLPDQRVMLIGAGRREEAKSEAMIAVLTADGQRDTRFAEKGYRLYDLGGAADIFWDAALSPQRTHVAVVGVRSPAAGAGNDDGAVLVLPIGR